MIAALTFFLFFLLPFFVIPFFPFAFETPKVLIAQVCIECLFLATILFGKFPWARLYTWQGGILLSLAVVSFITFLPQPHILFGNVFRLQGIVLFWHLLLLAFLAPAWKRDTRTQTIALFLLGVLCFCGFLFGTNLSGRAVGTLGEPNAFAATGVFFWVIAVYKRPVWQKIIAAGFVSAILVLSQSRSGLIAFSISLLFVFLREYVKLPLLQAAIVCLLLLAGSYSLPFFEANKVYENRVEIWHAALVAGWDRPVFGWGIGNIQEPIKQASYRIDNNNIRFQVVDSSHNIWLDMWVQMGIVGVLSTLILSVHAFYVFISKQKVLELGLFFVVLTALSFNPVSIVTLLLFWWLIGQGMEKG